MDFSQTLKVKVKVINQFKKMPCRVKIYLHSLFIIYPCRHENRRFPAHSDITAESHCVIKQHTGITAIFQLHRLFSDFFLKTVFISPKESRLTMDCLNVGLLFFCFFLMLFGVLFIATQWNGVGVFLVEQRLKFFVKHSHVDRINSGEKNNFS